MYDIIFSMKIVRFTGQNFIPASHEDPKDPGALKKVLFQKDDLEPGRIQMINWATIPPGKSFTPHYHENMFEVFIIMSGRVKVRVNEEEAILEKGDGVVVPEKGIHEMTNLGEAVCEYIAMGVVTKTGGKTVNVE